MAKVLVSAAGNLLEWYDFACFGIFADEIGSTFFPCSDDQTARIRAFAVFAGAFIVRPLGGVMFGSIGDNHGREVALMLTILCMAAPTLGIALLPGHDSIGLAAPVLLTAMRLLQGIAAGGELPGALVFAVESAPPSRRGLVGSLVQVCASSTQPPMPFLGTMSARARRPAHWSGCCWRASLV